MRLAVLDLLASESQHHLSSEDIYQRLMNGPQKPTLSTIYRVLSDLETAQIVVRHHFNGEASVFELKGEEHHDHLVCNRCGEVIEFQDEVIEKRLHNIAEVMGFQIKDRALHLHGDCYGQQCKARRQSSR